MPLSILDPNTALIVVDLQSGIVALPGVRSMDAVVRNAVALLAAFRRHGLPIVLVNVAGGAPGRTEQIRNAGAFPAGWTELIPELKFQPDEHRVTKQTWGAFTGTDLDAYLKQRGVTQVVLAGVATSVGVESTARHAYELGYNVTLAIDAMTDMQPEAHANSISRIFPKLGETGSTQEVIDLLNGAAA